MLDFVPARETSTARHRGRDPGLPRACRPNTDRRETSTEGTERLVCKDAREGNVSPVSNTEIAEMNTEDTERLAVPKKDDSPEKRSRFHFSVFGGRRQVPYSPPWGAAMLAAIVDTHHLAGRVQVVLSGTCGALTHG